MTATRAALLHLRLLTALLLVPPLVFGAAVAATGGEASPLAVQPVLVIACALFSTLAGAFTLALRIMAELKTNHDAGTPDKPLFAPWATGISHVIGSWLAGALFFMLGMAWQEGVWMLMAQVLMASVGGAKVLESAVDNWLLKKLGAKAG
jgi:hypothetical protein